VKSSEFSEEVYMPTEQIDSSGIIAQFSSFLRGEGYCDHIIQHYPPVARRFLAYFLDEKRPLETARLADVECFVRGEELAYRQRYGRAPRNMRAWRTAHAAPPRILLRLVLGHAPHELPPGSRREEFHRSLLSGYDAWMRELRGLAVITRRQRRADAKRILDALGDRGDPDVLRNVEVRDIDTYVHDRSVGLRRPSIKSITGNLRIFLRYLHSIGATARDLSSSVTSPKMYTYEGIPSALRAEDVAKALAVTRQDRTAAGVRDYAILQLLATYGLRAGEVTALRLDDIDWKKDVLHIRHSKTGAHSSLPLLWEPGEALLAYLERARPRSGAREVFLRLRAPYRGLTEGSSLYGAVRKRVEAAGVSMPGQKGPHTFRHARAVSLLRAAVPLKAIGDILGHRSAVSTGAYLKLATEDLRAVALDVPTPVSP
jgi:site-specific recombinase XerD